VIKINKIALAPPDQFGCAVGCTTHDLQVNTSAIAVDSIPRRKPTLSKAIAAPLACNPMLDYTIQRLPRPWLVIPRLTTRFSDCRALGL